MTTPITITCASEAQTQRLGETLALALRIGDVVLLNGDLGAGKTTLARALIRSAAGDESTEVPSPTFTIVQHYEGLPFGDLAHVDLYRLQDPSEIAELGLDDATQNGVVLVEWPERGQDDLPSATINITIQHGDADMDVRRFHIAGEAAALRRVNRSIAMRRFLDENGHQKSKRQHLTGDASSRSYETIHAIDGASIIAMNAPKQADGPAVYNGLPYSQIAHLAEDMKAFSGVQRALTDNGFRAPEIYAEDLYEGFLLIENLGNATIIDEARAPIINRYEAAAETLAAIHSKDWSTDIKNADGSIHHIPTFDRGVLQIEVSLLSQWYAPYILKRTLTADEESDFQSIWDALYQKLEKAEHCLLLRDYHSPNIIWMGDAEGTDRIGLIDFQDALIGPAAYDMASLAQDARVDIPAALESHLLDHYCNRRSSFDEGAFRQAYAIMAAQRVTKVLGIFVRLSQRDGKHGYLQHLPRMRDYLSRSLSHPALADYRAWVETVLQDKTAV